MLTRKRKFTEKQPEPPSHSSTIKKPATCIATSTELLTNSRFANLVSPLTQQQKYNLLCNVRKPWPEYKFQVNARGRRFQDQLLMKFPWLIYFQILDGAFCINCLLFGGESTHNASKFQKLYKAPLTTWSTALQKFCEHPEKSPVQLDCIRKKQIQNRERLRSIVGAIILCGRQNIPLRGHWDDSKHLLDSSLNPGNL